MNLRCCFCGAEQEGSAELLANKGWASRRVAKGGKVRITTACPLHAELIDREAVR